MIHPSFLFRNFHSLCLDQTLFCIRSFLENGFLYLASTSSKILPAASPAPLVLCSFSDRWTYARGNERGTRDSSGFRLSSITRLDVSLPYQQQFPEIRLALGIISPREFPSRHRRCVLSSTSLYLSFSLPLSLFLSRLYLKFYSPLSVLFLSLILLSLRSICPELLH